MGFGPNGVILRRFESSRPCQFQERLIIMAKKKKIEIIHPEDRNLEYRYFKPNHIKLMYRQLYWNVFGDKRQSYRERAEGMSRAAKEILEKINKSF